MIVNQEEWMRYIRYLPTILKKEEEKANTVKVVFGKSTSWRENFNKINTSWINTVCREVEFSVLLM